MNTAMALRGNSDRTFLTHLLARGLEDESYVVERFQAMVDGDICRMPGDEPTKKGRCKAKRTTVSLKDVQALRPARNEIIICTGLSARPRLHQASQSTFTLRHARLTTSLLTAPRKSPNSARFTRRVLVPDRYTEAISASAFLVSRW